MGGIGDMLGAAVGGGGGKRGGGGGVAGGAARSVSTVNNNVDRTGDTNPLGVVSVASGLARTNVTGQQGPLVVLGGPARPVSGTSQLGVILAGQETIGGLWRITLPNGRQVVLPQTHIWNPRSSTASAIGLTYGAAKALGIPNSSSQQILKAEYLGGGHALPPRATVTGRIPDPYFNSYPRSPMPPYYESPPMPVSQQGGQAPMQRLASAIALRRT